tara:strand:- start:1590 stop:2099 length:510 start_codon:yes stop_codon:yes gene_type:complete
MLSLSDNEFAVLNFLIRNFTSKDTVRSIAKKLGFSPAGVYNILKKLEKLEIVNGEKFGTGLFFRLNLENKVACYLSLTVLVGFYDHSIDLEDKKSGSSFAIYDKKRVLFLSDSSDIDLGDVEVVVKTEEEFVNAVKEKDDEILSILRDGNVIFGEESLLEIIKKFNDRF